MADLAQIIRWRRDLDARMPKALEVMDSLLESTDDAVRFKAAKEVFERVLGRAWVAKEEREEREPQRHMTPTELRALADRIERVGDLIPGVQ